MTERHAVTIKLATPYERAKRTQKSALINRLVELTSCHRDDPRHELDNAAIVHLVTIRWARTAKLAPYPLDALVSIWSLRQFG